MQMCVPIETKCPACLEMPLVSTGGRVPGGYEQLSAVGAGK